MRPMRSLATAVVLLVVVPQLHAADPVEWRVVNVHDGDTLTALDDTNTQHRIRLLPGWSAAAQAAGGM